MVSNRSSLENGWEVINPPQAKEIDNRWKVQHQDSRGQLSIPKDGNRFAYRVNVSGYGWEEIKVNFDGKHVIIKGEHNETIGGEHILRIFKRRFVVPEGMDYDTMECYIDDYSVLSLHGAKKGLEVNKKHVIPVSVEKVALDATHWWRSCQ